MHTVRRSTNADASCGDAAILGALPGQIGLTSPQSVNREGGDCGRSDRGEQSKTCKNSEGDHDYGSINDSTVRY